MPCLYSGILDVPVFVACAPVFLTPFHPPCVWLAQELTWVIGRMPRDKTPQLVGSIGLAGAAPGAVPSGDTGAASALGTASASAAVAPPSVQSELGAHFSVASRGAVYYGDVCIQHSYVSSQKMQACSCWLS